jgi:hypothetical protein
MDQITVALNGAGDLLAEVGSTVEGVLNRLHSKVCVTTIYNLKKSNLWVTGKVNVLSAIGNKLHQTTTSHFLYPGVTKKFLKIATCKKKSDIQFDEDHGICTMRYIMSVE